MSIYLVLSLCAIGDRSFISLNIVCLLSIASRISTQLSMTSSSDNEALNAATFNIFTRHFVEFERCFCSKTDHFTGNLGANMIKHVSQMELYNILSTLEKFEHWNETVLITKYQWMKPSP